MVQYIIPLSSLLLTFLASAASIRFLFSRQGLYWIMPLLTGIVLTLGNVYMLFFPSASPLPRTGILSFLPLAVSFLWYMMVITFHYALKKRVRQNRFRSDMKKNWAEASFLAKNERRNFFRRARRKRESEANSYFQPEVSPFDNIDISQFDS